MLLFMAEYGTARVKETLVAGVPGKIIRVTRICLGTSGDGKFKLLSDPDGPDEYDLTTMVRVPSNCTLDLVLGRRYAVFTGRGKSLALTDTFGVPSSNHSVMVWYELVD